MIQNILFKILMSPFSLLYGLGVGLRNFFYKTDVLKAVEFDLPVISVGNLSIGGAGKTPHIEYLIRLLQPYINVATLSRGYKRKTKGYLKVEARNNAERVGDEPLQYKRKFPEVLVTVAESRTFAIPKMIMEMPHLHTVLLDDAFQHLSIKPGLNILLTEYNYPFTRDYLLPSGRLREWRSAYKRADIIIVSKCPDQITAEQKLDFINEIAPLSYQKVFFSYYNYLEPYHLYLPNRTIQLTEDLDVILICAIARTEYLVKYLENNVNYIQILEYEDHHYFSKYDVSHLKQSFDQIESDNKIILTTEKDAMRLELHKDFLEANNLPIFALPIEVDFHFDEKEDFDRVIKNYLLNFRN